MSHVDFTKVGTVKINSMLIDEFNTIQGTFNTASHKFYTVRKKLAKEHNSDVFMNVTPTDFFEALKRYKANIKRQEEITQRKIAHAKRMEQWHKNDNGDFDDMGRSKYANKYFEGNKRRHGLL